MAERALRLLDSVMLSQSDDPAEPVLLVRGSLMVRIRAAGAEVRRTVASLRHGVRADSLAAGGAATRALMERLTRLGWLTEERPYVPTGQVWDRQVGWWYAVTTDGQAAQRRLRAASVVVLGVGGIGAAVARHLVAGGVGDLWLLDHDSVVTDNLNRQYLYGADDVGRPKAEAAADALVRAAGSLRVRPVRVEVTAPSDLDVVTGKPDLLVMAADQPRDLMDHVWSWAVARGVPVIAGGVALSCGYWGPLLVPAEGDCWFCVERDRVARLTPEERRLEHEGAPTAHSFGPTNGLVADYLARDAMLFLGVGRCASRGRRQVVDVLGIDDVPRPADRPNIPCCPHGDG